MDNSLEEQLGGWTLGWYVSASTTIFFIFYSSYLGLWEVYKVYQSSFSKCDITMWNTCVLISLMNDFIARMFGDILTPYYLTLYLYCNPFSILWWVFVGTSFFLCDSAYLMNCAHTRSICDLAWIYPSGIKWWKGPAESLPSLYVAILLDNGIPCWVI